MDSCGTVKALFERSPPRMPPKNGWLKSAPSTLMLLLMPRWPANDSWPRLGSTCTVGVAEMKSWNRRPLIGRLAIASRSTVVVRTVAEVSTSGEPAATVTVSCTPPTWSCVLMVCVAPTLRTRLRRVGAKPVSSLTRS